ncbi:hypothetical protein BV22DRAFT_1135696 [Leucogyrophana mollusca]|uniref:Uncharacterized protein n=1 Tax=Leucogyrophana mollusca TaxID=85980 RepID=A0ACB8AUB9_9AGAM|nr:hypothetical protein BV22DRAFT_1135696 [Leucogyrophana mollusca]
MLQRLLACFTPVTLGSSGPAALRAFENNPRNSESSRQALSTMESVTDTWMASVDTQRMPQPISYYITTALLDALNAAFIESYPMSRRVGMGVSGDAKGEEGYHNYIEKAVDVITKHADAFEDDGLPATKVIMEGAGVKARIILECPGQVGHSLPFLTSDALSSLEAQLAQLKESIKEVSRWGNPMIDYNQKMTRGVMMQSSHSQSFFEAIQQNTLLERNSKLAPLLAVHILRNYGAYLSFENQMNRVTHTPRTTVGSKIMTLFEGKKKRKDDDENDIDEEDEEDEEDEDDCILQELRMEHKELKDAMMSTKNGRKDLWLDYLGSEFRGRPLVHFSSWRWQDTESKSAAAKVSQIAGAAILETGIIDEYRELLLKDSEGGAAAVRASIEAEVERFVRTPTQRRLSGTVKWIWPDAIEVTGAAHVHTFDMRMLLAERENQMVIAQEARRIQTVVDALERLPLSWDDPNFRQRGKRAPIQAEVADALADLVHAIERNAFKNRTLANLKRWNANHVEDQEWDLRINLRGDASDTGVPNLRSATVPSFKEKKGKSPASPSFVSEREGGQRTSRPIADNTYSSADVEMEQTDADHGPGENNLVAMPGDVAPAPSQPHPRDLET